MIRGVTSSGSDLDQMFPMSIEMLHHICTLKWSNAQIKTLIILNRRRRRLSISNVPMPSCSKIFKKMRGKFFEIEKNQKVLQFKNKFVLVVTSEELFAISVLILNL